MTRETLNWALLCMDYFKQVESLVQVYNYQLYTFVLDQKYRFLGEKGLVSEVIENVSKVIYITDYEVWYTTELDAVSKYR